MILIPADPQMVSAAEYLLELGELDAVGLLRFFEKPSRYPELITLWDDECERAYDEQELRRATL